MVQKMSRVGCLRLLRPCGICFGPLSRSHERVSFERFFWRGVLILFRTSAMPVVSEIGGTVADLCSGICRICWQAGHTAPGSLESLGNLKTRRHVGQT